MPPEENENGIFTQLRLNQQSIELLIRKVDDHHAEIRGLIQDHEDRIRTLETASTQMRERQTNLAVVQGFFTAISSAVAAAFGKFT